MLNSPCQNPNGNCDICNFRNSCATLLSRRLTQQPNNVIDFELNSQSTQEEFLFYAKWLWVLFIFYIVHTISNLITSEYATNHFPELFTLGEILGLIAELANVVAFLNLASRCTAYRKPAYCHLALMFLGMFALFFASYSDFITLIGFIAAIINIYVYYTSIRAHASLTEGISDELSKRWHKIWKWTLCSYLSFIAGFIIILFRLLAPGVILISASAIAILIVTILYLACLYRTANMFREYTMY